MFHRFRAVRYSGQRPVDIDVSLELEMKEIRTSQAKVLGALGILGAILCGIILAMIHGELIAKIGAGCGMTYFLFLAVEGLTAKSFLIDGPDCLVPSSNNLKRIPLSEVVSARTFPIFRYVGVVTIIFRDGEKVRTMVADQDLTWIMSHMPPSSRTPYWRK